MQRLNFGNKFGVLCGVGLGVTPRVSPGSITLSRFFLHAASFQKFGTVGRFLQRPDPRRPVSRRLSPVILGDTKAVEEGRGRAALEGGEATFTSRMFLSSSSPCQLEFGAPRNYFEEEERQCMGHQDILVSIWVSPPLRIRGSFNMSI